MIIYSGPPATFQIHGGGHLSCTPNLKPSLRILFVIAAALVLIAPFVPSLGAQDTGSRATTVVLSDFDGGSSTEMVTMNAPGMDNSTTFSLPADCLVVDASMDVIWDNYSEISIVQQDYNDRKNCTAWNGTSSSVLTETISQLQETMFNESDGYKKVRAYDGAWTSWFNDTYDVYELYRFNVTLTEYDNITVHWSGFDFQGALGGSTNLYVYNHTSSAWENQFTTTYNPSTLEANASIELGAATDQLGSSNQIYVLVHAPLFLGFSIMMTDYVSLNFSVSTDVSPEDVYVDIGGDGSQEVTQAGTFTGTTTLDNSTGFMGAIQAIVDAAATTAVVEIEVGTTTGADVTIENLNVVYRTNQGLTLTSGQIPSVHVMEDTPSGWTSVITNLADYFTDGDGDTLQFSIVDREDQTNVDATINGTGVDVTIATDFYGSREFTVQATDGGLDQDFMTTGDNEILLANVTVNVNPTNDAPIIHDISGVIVGTPTNLSGLVDATQDQELILTVNYSDPDGDSGSFSVEGAPAGLIKSADKITWTPDNDLVGFHTFTVNVTDQNSTGGTMYAVTEVVVEVINAPDAPVLAIPSIPYAYEDKQYNLTFSATDIDEKYHESLIFSTNRTAGADKIDGWVLSPNGFEAVLVFTPTQDDVGDVFMNVSVEDHTGLVDYEHITITIRNTNDAPWGVINSPDEGEGFYEGDLVEFNITVYDDDTVFDDLVLVTWTSNVSGEIGMGEYMNTTELEVGAHEITVELTDGEESISYTLNITISPAQTTDGGDGGGGDGGGGDGGDGGSGGNGSGNGTDGGGGGGGGGGGTTDGGDGGETDNTMMYAGIGIAAAVIVLLLIVVVIVVVIVMVTKKKKEPETHQGPAIPPEEPAMAEAPVEGEMAPQPYPEQYPGQEQPMAGGMYEEQQQLPDAPMQALPPGDPAYQDPAMQPQEPQLTYQDPMAVQPDPAIQEPAIEEPVLPDDPAMQQPDPTVPQTTDEPPLQ